MCFPELGQAIDMKLWFMERSSSKICCKENTSKWFWTLLMKKEIIEKPTCTWLKIESWVWASIASKTDDTSCNTSLTPSPTQILWNRINNWWFNVGAGSTQATSLFFMCLGTTTTTPWNPVTTSWENTFSCQSRCSSPSSPSSTATSFPLSTFSHSIPPLYNQVPATSFNTLPKYSRLSTSSWLF